MALPAAFEQRMQRLLGEEYPAFRDALARPQARGLRGQIFSVKRVAVKRKPAV